MSIIPTIDLHSQHHYAQDTEASMYVAFNRDGCCIYHPDLLLRQRNLLRGWKIIHTECPRCAEEWSSKRKNSQLRFNEVYSSLNQLMDLEKGNAERHEKQMSSLQGNMEAQLQQLRMRVNELQDENSSLLVDVDRLKKEIDESNLAHAQKVKSLTEEKIQLMKESEAAVDGSFASLQSAIADLSSRMDKMGSGTAAGAHSDSVKKQNLTNVGVVNRTTAPSLPAEIQACNADLESTRNKLLSALQNIASAKDRLLTEETGLRSRLMEVMPEAEVEERIKTAKTDIDQTGSVSTPVYNALRDAYQLHRMTQEEVQLLKVELKPLQRRNFILHKEYDFLFSCYDVNFQRLLPEELIAFGSSLKELKEVGFPARSLRTKGFSLAEFKQAGFTVCELQTAGYSIGELRDVRYNVDELFTGGYSLTELTGVGLTAAELKSVGFTLHDLKSCCPSEQLWSAFTARELRGAGVYLIRCSRTDVKDRKDAGYTASDFKNAGMSKYDIDHVFSYTECVNAGY